MATVHGKFDTVERDDTVSSVFATGFILNLVLVVCGQKCTFVNRDDPAELFRLVSSQPIHCHSPNCAATWSERRWARTTGTWQRPSTPSSCRPRWRTTCSSETSTTTITTTTRAITPRAAKTRCPCPPCRRRPPLVDNDKVAGAGRSWKDVEPDIIRSVDAYIPNSFFISPRSKNFIVQFSLSLNVWCIFIPFWFWLTLKTMTSSFAFSCQATSKDMLGHLR